MQLVVDLLPKAPPSADAYDPSLSQPLTIYRDDIYRDDVVVVIDVLRSCTLAALLFEHGLNQLYVSKSVRSVRKFAKARATQQPALLLGERDGIPPEGFNYGSTLTELLNVDVQGKAALLLAENMPSALSSVRGAAHVLLGSLYNAEAVMRHAAALARGRIHLVCSGFQGDEDLDDTLAAGYLAALLEHVIYPDMGATDTLMLGGTAAMAMTLLKAFHDPLEALWHARAGQVLRRADLASDIAFASHMSQSDAVPRLRQVISEHPADLYHFEVLR